MFVTALYKVYVIWTFCGTGNIKVYESLPVVLLDLKSSILREVSARSPGRNAVLFLLEKFLLEALAEIKLLSKKLILMTYS